MRGFLIFCVLLAAVILGVGFWRGWFLVDRERIDEDRQKAVERIKGAGEKIQDKVDESSDR